MLYSTKAPGTGNGPVEHQGKVADGYPQGEIQGLSCREAGRRGGLSTLERHGRKHFRNIGMVGQKELASRCGSEERRCWGRLGGRPKKVRYFGDGSGIFKKGREGEPARDPSPSNINTPGENIHLAVDEE